MDSKHLFSTKSKSLIGSISRAVGNTLYKYVLGESTLELQLRPWPNRIELKNIRGLCKALLSPLTVKVSSSKKGGRVTITLDEG